MPEYHVLSLGAGVQSTTIYLMILDGELKIPINSAVFADTQEEPDAVYRHLEWLKSLGGPPIATVTAGKLGSDLMSGRNSTGHRFASIPAFTVDENGKQGMIRRQCTTEYKIEVIEKWIRYELIGLRWHQWMPRDVTVHQYMGFSLDEPGRAARARNRFNQIRWGSVHFPLFELEMTRADCQEYLKSRVPHPVPRSACVFCPFKNSQEWRHLRDNDPGGWARAVEVDNALRIPGNVVNRGLNQKLYIHRSCVPLAEADLEDKNSGLFELECEGGCGL
jgi:hypothetical protein